MRIAAVVAIGVMLSGCGAVSRTSGAMPVGPDTWKVTARGSMGNPIDSQKMALGEASSHCAGMGKQLLVTNTSSRPRPEGTYEVTFRCLNPGDPDLQRPNLQPVPDAVIQVR